MPDVEVRVAEAQALLRDLGFDAERSNERSALTLLVLLGIRPTDPSGGRIAFICGNAAIMNGMRDHYGKEYAANSRETIRRFTLHQFVDVLLVEQNPDEPDRPVNSPKWCYAIHPEALEVARKVGTPEYDEVLNVYLARRPGLVSVYEAARQMNRIPVVLPNGNPIALSPGGQNVLLKAMVDDFCSYFTPGGEVLYVGDADQKWAVSIRFVLLVSACRSISMGRCRTWSFTSRTRTGSF